MPKHAELATTKHHNLHYALCTLASQPHAWHTILSTQRPDTLSW
jgi:hypothetical protein